MGEIIKWREIIRWGEIYGEKSMVRNLWGEINGEKLMVRNLWGEICGEKSIDGLSARSDYPPVFDIRIRQVSVSA